MELSNPPQIIPSNPLAAFPHNGRQNNDSEERKMNAIAITIINHRKKMEPGIEQVTSCSQVP